MNTNFHDDKAGGGSSNDGGRKRRSLWKGPARTAALLLVIPLLGSHFVDGWHWPPGAFIVLGILLFGIGLAYELVARNMDAVAYRAAVGVAFAAGFLLVWGNVVQYADVNPAAVMYFGVPIVGIIGAVMARLRPAGMARALFATALAQALVLVIALIIRDPQITYGSPAVLRGFAGNAFFAMLFVGSALLFRKAGREESTPRPA